MEPPEMINAGEVVLKRWEPAWAPAALEAVRESLPELKPYMPWAHDGYGLDDETSFLQMCADDWAKGTAFNYAMFTATGELIGSVGLMTRMGPGTLEIGYWIRTAYAGQGRTTTAVRALTRVALSLPGVERAAIRYDASNVASERVAVKAGFVEAERIAREPRAPGETGTDVIRELRV